MTFKIILISGLLCTATIHAAGSLPAMSGGDYGSYFGESGADGSKKGDRTSSMDRFFADRVGEELGEVAHEREAEIDWGMIKAKRRLEEEKAREEEACRRASEEMGMPHLGVTDDRMPCLSSAAESVEAACCSGVPALSGSYSPFLESRDNLLRYLTAHRPELRADAQKLLELVTPEEFRTIEGILPNAEYMRSSCNYMPSASMDDRIFEVLPRKEIEETFIIGLRFVVDNVLSIRDRGGVFTGIHGHESLFPMTLKAYVSQISLAFSQPRAATFHAVQRLLELNTEFPRTRLNEILLELRETLLVSGVEVYESRDINCLIAGFKLRSLVEHGGWRWPETLEGYQQALGEFSQFARKRD